MDNQTSATGNLTSALTSTMGTLLTSTGQDNITSGTTVGATTANSQAGESTVNGIMTAVICFLIIVGLLYCICTLSHEGYSSGRGGGRNATVLYRRQHNSDSSSGGSLMLGGMEEGSDDVFTDEAGEEKLESVPLNGSGGGDDRASASGSEGGPHFGDPSILTTFCEGVEEHCRSGLQQ